MSKLFRIQYAHSITQRMKPCAPYLAITGPIANPAVLQPLASKWARIFYIQGAPIGAHPAIHFLGGGPFFCEKENVALVRNPECIGFWSDYGALVCSVTPTLPSSPLKFPLRLAIYDTPDGTVCRYQTENGIPCVTNSTAMDAWMEFPCMDTQEVEAITKADQTPLRTSTYLEDADIMNVYQSF